MNPIEKVRNILELIGIEEDFLNKMSVVMVLRKNDKWKNISYSPYIALLKIKPHLSSCMNVKV